MSFTYWPKRFLDLGFFKIESEAFFITIAFIFLIYWILKQLKIQKLELKAKDLSWFLFAAIFGALAGGRLWYYITNWQGLQTIKTIFDLSIPGLVSYGMIIGGTLSILLFSYFYNKKNLVEKKWDLLFAKYMDIAAIAAALFVFIYRMGCFHFGDVPGTATKPPWGMFAINYGEFTGTIMHPTALYLSFSALLIFLFLNWYKDRKKFDGELGWLFIIFYSFNRFWIEFLRDITPRYFGLNTSQIVLIPIFIISMAALIVGQAQAFE